MKNRFFSNDFIHFLIKPNILIIPTIILRHRVGDFNTWIKGHQDRVELFKSVGSTFRTFQDADDPNSIILLLEVTDVDKLEKMVADTGNPEINEKKAKHTVIDPITVSMEVDV
jgi:hypothetical protein